VPHAVSKTRIVSAGRIRNATDDAPTQPATLHQNIRHCPGHGDVDDEQSGVSLMAAANPTPGMTTPAAARRAVAVSSRRYRSATPTAIKKIFIWPNSKCATATIVVADAVAANQKRRGRGA